MAVGFDLFTLVHKLSDLVLASNLFFFFFNDTATTEIYTLSYTTLFRSPSFRASRPTRAGSSARGSGGHRSTSATDRKSTRLNSSHSQISYAVFCLKKKKKATHTTLFHVLAGYILLMLKERRLTLPVIYL